MDLNTVFVIAVTTTRMIFPGISPTTTIGPQPEQPKIPAVKALTIEVYSNAEATGASKAQATVPPGLKATSPADMVVDKAGLVPPEAEKSAGSEAYITKTYWGSSDAIQENQPRTTKSAGSVQPAAPEGLPSASYAYWPPVNAKPLDSGASAVGDYSITTDFAGSTSITVDASQDFMPAVQLNKIAHKADMEKPLRIKWKPVANALAYLVTATGGNNTETVVWLSSSSPDAPVGNIEYRPLSKDELDKLVQSGALLPATATTCTVPGGIFTSSRSVLLTVVAIGQDRVEVKDGVETRVIVRSIASAPVKGISYEPGPDLGPKDEETQEKPTAK